MQGIFATAPLDGTAWLKIVTVSAVIFIWLWAERRFSLRKIALPIESHPQLST
jgi:hypothetical protein